MDLVSEDSWSDSEPDACDQASLPLHSRAYQIEMFEQSMQGNIIAIVRTGSCPSIDSTDIYVDGYWEWKDSSVSILSGARRAYFRRSNPRCQHSHPCQMCLLIHGAEPSYASKLNYNVPSARSVIHGYMSSPTGY
jgi:hypothetical protein